MNQNYFLIVSQNFQQISHKCFVVEPSPAIASHRQPSPAIAGHRQPSLQKKSDAYSNVAWSASALRELGGTRQFRRTRRVRQSSLDELGELQNPRSKTEFCVQRTRELQNPRVTAGNSWSRNSRVPQFSLSELYEFPKSSFCRTNVYMDLE